MGGHTNNERHLNTGRAILGLTELIRDRHLERRREHTPAAHNKNQQQMGGCEHRVRRPYTPRAWFLSGRTATYLQMRAAGTATSGPTRSVQKVNMCLRKILAYTKGERIELEFHELANIF